MELHTHIAITLRISRNDEVAIIQTKIRVAHVSLHDKVTLGIVATRRTYHVDKSLVIGVLNSQILGFRLAPVILDMDLVGSGKGHSIVVTGKFAGDVKPQQS